MTMHFLINVANDAESTQKNRYYAIFASLKSEQMGKLINKIPGLRFSIPSLPGSASRTHVEFLGKPRDSTSILKALPSKLDIKKTLNICCANRN